MEKTKNFYECLFIVNPTVGEEALKATVNKFMTLISENGTIIESAEWGKRRLAYPINDIPEGYYVIVYFEADSTLPMELERKFGIDEAIMRCLITRPETRKVSTVNPVEKFERPERPARRFDNRRFSPSEAPVEAPVEAPANAAETSETTASAPETDSAATTESDN